jgi:hypothetical protein
MKNRFPTLHRATWRSRFIAIARQADTTSRVTEIQPRELAPRRAANPAVRSAIRVRFAALVSH